VDRTLRAAGQIAANDLRRRMRNRSFILQAFIGPIILASLISAAFGGSFGFDATIGIVVEDHSELGDALRSRFEDLGVEGLKVDVLPSEAAAVRAVDDEDVGAALVIPAGFQASLATDAPKAIGLVVDNDRLISGAVARAVANGFAARVNAGRLATVALLAADRPAPDPATLADIALPVSLVQRSPGDEVSPAAAVGPGIGLLFLFLSVAIVARTLYEERRLRVLDRIRSAPVTMSAILLGKGLAVVAMGVVSLLTLWATTAALLGAHWGQPLAVVLLIVAAACSVAGIAAAVAGLVRTERSADLYATAVAFVLGIVGGSLVPLSELPPGLLRLSLLTPNGWALRGFAELSAGDGGVVDVLPHIGVLLVWALAGGAIGVVLLPRRLGTR
jgi:ABC-2 type transport system permease protein